MAHAAEKPEELSPKKAIEVHNQTLDNYLRDIDFESMSPEDILTWTTTALNGERIVLSTSFQYSGVAMIHMVSELGLKVRAWIKTTAVAGVDWTRMGRGPIPATTKALDRAGLTIEDMSVIELNEAFAAQALFVMREAGFPAEKTNLLGGAIALGHPLGRSGVRIIGAAVTALEQKNERYALATMCVGGGQGVAAVFERK